MRLFYGYYSCYVHFSCRFFQLLETSMFSFYWETMIMGHLKEHNITFGIYPSPNMQESEALWKEKHQLIITQGKVSQILGLKTHLNITYLNLINYMLGYLLKNYQIEYLPLISVPAAVVSKYSVYAREIEYTNEWMKVNTQNQRVGSGLRKI